MTRPDHHRARRKLSPHSEAVAFRIWAHCDPIGWDCTSRDVADALGIDGASVGQVCRLKGWTQRLRVDGPDSDIRSGLKDGRSGNPMQVTDDAMLDAIASRGSA